MARYRRIVADQFMDGPRPSTLRLPCIAVQPNQIGERQNIAGILPGMALVLGVDRTPAQEVVFEITPTSSNRVIRAHGGPTPNFALAGINPTAPIWIADVDTLAGRGMDDQWRFLDSIEAIAVASWGRALNVLVRAGANVVKGGGLTTDAYGRFTPAGAGDRVIMVADETYNNNTGIPQHVRALPSIGV